MGTPKSLYEVLGVSPQADATEVKSAWRSRLMQVHPDHGGTAAATIELQAAYEVLRDTHRRRAYDSARAAAEEGGRRWVNDLFDDVADDFDGADDAWSATMADAYEAAHDDAGQEDVYDWVNRVRADAHLSQCEGITKTGRRCLNARLEGSAYCWVHQSGIPSVALRTHRCNTCAVAHPIRGAFTCWRHSSAEERESARRAPAGQCLSRTKAGHPCHARPTADGFCAAHSRKNDYSIQWEQAEKDEAAAAPRAHSRSAPPTERHLEPEGPTVQSADGGCGSAVIGAVALLLIGIAVAQSKSIRDELSSLWVTTVTVMVGVALLAAFAKRSRR